METPEIIDGLKDLIKDRNSFIDQNEPDNVFEHDKEILKAAIDALSAARESDNTEVLEAYQELLQKSQGLNETLLKKLKTKNGDVLMSEYKNTAQSATNTRAENKATDNLKVPQNKGFVKRNIVAYKGIGPERGTTVSADDALPYAMLRCGITFDCSENIGDCRQEFVKTLVDWFYSGNWMPITIEREYLL
ncbi:hypothetical protein [Caproicibacterium sp. BJN0003]|uniref:hypothetical protein n=1 Tax=Caproicibacterium sp. BJN0003 TaxID=2994078 RepID=UPI0022569934|nr:hypothetical protein [Caproicibacterium sp. BJN0003]UZT82660.1 hypothetical protein OP489_02275 [Caproicibacterium sp. BJN0003]